MEHPHISIYWLSLIQTLFEWSSSQMMFCNSPWQWMCGSGECIAQYDVCNGIPQCSDGSDENYCDKEQMGMERNLAEERRMRPTPSVIERITTTTNSNGTSLSLMTTVDIRWIVLATVALTLGAVLLCSKLRTRRIQNRAFGLKRTAGNEDDEDDLLISSLYT